MEDKIKKIRLEEIRTDAERERFVLENYPDYISGYVSGIAKAGDLHNPPEGLDKKALVYLKYNSKTQSFSIIPL
ncbi:MAG: hypothetical protein KKF48_01985 [Nanoarchaeota archaeon]|nr:hypothetical protein [Nanoarchaeota archaeon]MBU1027790.1 hypothetical protein [Nanoarchaeota archaeon]